MVGLKEEAVVVKQRVGLIAHLVERKMAPVHVVERMHPRVVSVVVVPPAPRVKRISVGRVHHDGFDTLHRMSC